MRTSSSSKIRHPPPGVSNLLGVSVSMKVKISARCYTCSFQTQCSSIKAKFFSVLFSCFCFQSLYTRVFQNKARYLNISTTQSLINSLWCYAKLKPFNVTITACIQSPPRASQTAIIIFVIGSSFCLPRPLLFLCWEGDGRHLLAHLFTLQTRPKLVAFPVVFQKQVIK